MEYYIKLNYNKHTLFIINITTIKGKWLIPFAY